MKNENSITSFKGENHFLSNFYPCKIPYIGYVFNSVEAAYQACKCPIHSDLSQFVGISAAASKKLGKSIDVRKDWDMVKLWTMETLLNIKFKNEELKQKLLETEDKELIEGNWWNDRFYGVCKGVGENHLGKLLMKLRSYYKLEQISKIYE